MIERTEQLGGGIGAREQCAGPAGDEEDNGIIGEPARGERERARRRLVEPVQIVDDEEDRPIRAGDPQQRDGGPRRR